MQSAKIHHNIRVSTGTRKTLNDLRWPRATYDDVIRLLVGHFMLEDPNEVYAGLRRRALLNYEEAKTRATTR